MAKLATTAFALITFFIASNSQNTTKWVLKQEASYVLFIAKNIGLKVNGKIAGMKVQGNYVEDKLTSSTFIASIETATINTGNSFRDNHLRSKDYFEVEKYPTIQLVSKSIVEENGSYVLVADVTIKGNTKEIKVPFKVSKRPLSHVLTGDAVIQRKDFYVGSNSTLLMADDIEVRIIATFVPEK